MSGHPYLPISASIQSLCLGFEQVAQILGIYPNPRAHSESFKCTRSDNNQSVKQTFTKVAKKKNSSRGLRHARC
jgi:poly(A) polymerase Pap1